MIDIASQIYAQFSNSPTIVALATALAEYFDPAKVEDDFYTNVFNIDTATGDGLDIWGRRLGVSRYLKIPFEQTVFGFQEADMEPFGQAPFFSGQKTAYNTVALSDDAFRKLLLAKALSNISNCSVPAINSLLRALFAGDRMFKGVWTGVPLGTFILGQDQLAHYIDVVKYSDACYVTRPENMHMRFVFEFTLTNLELAIVTQSGVLPVPAGVYADMIDGSNDFFGFFEAEMQPFDQGVFFNGDLNEVV